VAVRPCQVAVTPILGVVDLQLLFLPVGSRWHVAGLRGIVGLAQADGHWDEPFEDSCSPRPRFGYCLVTRADWPPPKVVRNLLRSDLTLL